MRMPIKIIFYFLCLGFLCPSLSEAATSADTLFFGGSIVTVTEKQATVEAMAVKDGKIAALGTLAEIKAWQGPQTRMIDLKGQALYPGFIEPHGHPFDSAFAQFYAVDVQPFTIHDAAALDKKIKETVAAAQPGAWILMNGIDPALQKDVKPPTLNQLDLWVPKNPFILIANSGHAAYANSLAMQKQGISAQTPDPSGGHIAKTPDGQLSGTFEEIPAMMLLLDPIIKSIDPQQMGALLTKYYAYLASHGIVAVSDMTFLADKLPLYQALAKDPKVPVRVRLYEVARKDNKAALPPMGGDDMVRQIGIKWWADGSPWQGSIALAEPYLDSPMTTQVLGIPPNSKGTLNYPNESDLQKWVEAYFVQGYQIAIHAEGERAIQEALNVMEITLKKNPTMEHRMRLEHAPLITEKQVAMAQTLGIPLSFLMAHLYYWGDVLPQIVGQERADRWNPTGWAHQYGIPYSFHNDGAVSPVDPLLDLQVAVLRETQSGKVLGPKQRVTLDEAIRARTINAARELFMDKQSGSLEAGKWADLVVLDRDPRKVNPREISQIKVLATYLNGKQVWPALQEQVLPSRAQN